jgi:chemotaxis methyl-accepting protein methylase
MGEIYSGSHKLHRERSVRRQRLVESRRVISTAERQFIALGPGDRIPGLHLVVDAGGWRAVVSAAQVVEVMHRVDLEHPPSAPPHAAGEFLYRGQKLVAFDLVSFLGVRREPPASTCVLVFSAGATFGLAIDGAELGCDSPLLVPGDPGSPESTWRHTRVLAQCGGEILPLLDPEGMAELLERVEKRPRRGQSRLEALLSAELKSLESSMEAHGLSLSRLLREKLRAHLAAAALEMDLEQQPMLPRILGGHPAAVCALLEEAVVGETYFFRDPAQLGGLRHFLFEAAHPGRALRVWSAGCGSGEEAYSVAMALAASRRAGTVLGTDIDELALEHARAAEYGRWSFRRPHPDLAGFLEGQPPRAVVVPEIRRLVEFRRHDVRQDPPEGDFDVVLCRNVLSLLDAEEADGALRRVLRAVRPGGYLLLGATESKLADRLPVERVVFGGAVMLRRPWSRGRARAAAATDAA